MTKGDSLGDRMKDYEKVAQTTVPRRSWTVIRLDGRAFHTFTKGLVRPFSESLAQTMDATAAYLCENIDGVAMAYVQSDEISLIIPQPMNLKTEPFFNGKVQKIVSIAASLATAQFNYLWPWDSADRFATFDARVFTVPDLMEAGNYLVWRQQDAVRNSISMAAQAQFSHKELQGKKSGQMQEMLWQKGINWNDYDARFKRGGQVVKVQRPDTVTFTHKGTGIEQTTNVLRNEWEIQSADSYTFAYFMVGSPT